MADVDITINTVTAPTDVKQGTTLSLSVDVTADAESFAEGMAYNLFVFVDGLKAGPLPGTPLTQTGTLQAAPWTAANSTIPFSITAGTAPDIYIVTASLLAGPTGSVFQVAPVLAANQVVVHT